MSKITIKHLGFSRTGGAGTVARILSEQQRLSGYSSSYSYLLESNLRHEPTKIASLTLAALADEYIIKNQNFNSLISIARDRITAMKEVDLTADVVHLHWINGLISSQEILQKAPTFNKVFWTLHDMNAFTGACHYSLNCENFLAGCSSCPATRQIFDSLVKENFQKKLELVNGLNSYANLTLIAPSRWIADMARNSEIFRDTKLHVLAQPISSKYFEAAPNRRIRDRNSGIRFGIIAGNLRDPIKGVRDAITVFESLSSKTSTLTLFGQGGADLLGAKRVFWAGHLPSDQLVKSLVEIDVLVVNSLYDNTPLVIAEAMAMGIPVLARSTGGIPEMVANYQTGILYKGPEELAEAMVYLENISDADLEAFSENARVYATAMHHPELVSSKHLDLYHAENGDND